MSVYISAPHKVRAVKLAGLLAGSSPEPTKSSDMDLDTESAIGSGLLSLPSCVLALIINQLEPRDQGCLRLVAAAVQEQTDRVLESVQASSLDIEKLTTLAQKLKALKHLLVSATGSSCRYKCYAELHSRVPDLVTVLAAHRSLKSLTLSSEAAQQLGALKWARMESQHAVSESGPSLISMQITAPQPSPLDSFYWVPDWLAAAPKLQQLTVEAPDSTLSSRISTQPVWLWLHPNAWANKLTCLQLRGVPLLSGTLAIQGLTQLQRLCLTGTQLRPSTVEHLLRQLSSCEQLTLLVLSGNDMCLLPEQGWEGVTGLKELDVSQQMLLELPVGLSHLTGLTTLQVHHNSLTTLNRDLASLSSLVHLSASHNWLSGAGPCLPHLLEAWPRLAVLELDNVSDKRGELVLPPQLAGCRHLRELSIRDNFSVNWTSVLAVLPNCNALKLLRLDRQVPADRLKDLHAVLRPAVVVSLE